MMPQPRRKPGFSCPRFILSDICELALIIWMIVTPLYYVLYDLPPQFSVRLAPTDDAPAPAAPVFRVALHASNRRATARCYSGGEGVVAYAGFTIASGQMPGFCVPGKGHGEVPFLVWRHGGVGLPDHLSDRMAAAHEAGALELEVQVRLLQSGNAATGRPSRMWCKARVGGGQPPEVIMCTVFALQNLFDFGP